MPKISVFFDPLCGWCYAIAPALEALAQQSELRLVPTGLFSQPGRRMTPEFAAHAWRNDQRIAQLTGQVFSQHYHDHILQQDTAFDSSSLLLALTWVQQQAPAQEVLALHALQKARYVDGLDTTQLTVQAQVLAQLGLGISTEAIVQALQSPELLAATQARLIAGQHLAQEFHVQGVPQAFIQTDDDWQAIASGELLQRTAELNGVVAP